MKAEKKHILPLVLTMELVMALDELEGDSLFKHKLKATGNRFKQVLESFIERSHAQYKNDRIATEEYSLMQSNFSRIIDGISLEDLLKPYVVNCFQSLFCNPDPKHRKDSRPGYLRDYATRKETGDDT